MLALLDALLKVLDPDRRDVTSEVWQTEFQAVSIIQIWVNSYPSGNVIPLQPP